MSGITQALLAVSGVTPPPAFPASSLGIWMPEYGPSVLNAAGTAAAHYDKVDKILDLSGNGRHGQQTSDALRLRYAKWEGENYWLNSVANNGGHVTAAEANDPTPANFTITMKLSAVSWDSGVIQWLIYKGELSPYYLFLYLETDGRLSLHRTNASGSAVITSSVATGFTAHQKAWIKVAYIANTGSGQYSCIFSTSSDGVTYTQLGTTLTGTTTGAMTGVAGSWRIGGKPVLTQYFVGRIYSCNIVDDSTSTTRLDWAASGSTHLATTGPASPSAITYNTTSGAIIGRSVLLGSTASGPGPMPLSSNVPITDQYTIAILAQGSTSGFTGIYKGDFTGLLGAPIANGTDTYVGTTGRWTQFQLNALTGVRNAMVAEGRTTQPQGLWRNGGAVTVFGNSTQSPTGGFSHIYYSSSANGILGRMGVWAGGVITEPTATAWLNA